MFKRNPLLIAVAFSLAACANGSANGYGTSTTSSAAATPAGPQLQWGPAPAVFPKGAEFVVMQGDPSKAEEFTVRLRFPDGYKIPPHTHPTAENVTVLAGTFYAGMGTQFDESQMKAFGRDDFASIPANHPHYAMARGQVVVQVHAIGPFVLTYVNPADTPVAAR
jgi:quercetin dioxygenase-like cupin family protein